MSSHRKFDRSPSLVSRRAAVAATALTVIAATGVASTSAHAQGATFVLPDSAKLTVSGYVDGYYAWDFGRPRTFDRSFAGGALFTTQPARHNEFNVNLAFVDVRVEGERYRGRFALQAGTSVQSNYSGEPTIGQISGPLLSRMIQEAVVGVKLADKLWVDGGIFFSHMGMEGWISRDNPTYSRSLVAEYSPYYQSGVKFTYGATSRLTAQLNVVNGWQNISENNSGKGAGLRLDYALTPTATFSYYNFFSDEAGTRLRVFSGIGTKASVGRMTYLAQFDIGSQKRPPGVSGSSSWYGLTAIARAQLTPIVALSGRFERYVDKDQVLIATGESAPGTPNGAFKGNGGSIGVDVTPRSRVLWRTELRGFRNSTSIFPNEDGAPKRDGGFAATSLALTF